MQVCSNPVEHRHKVVDDNFNAAFREVANACLVALNVPLEISRADFNFLAYWQAFDGAPFEPRVPALLKVRILLNKALLCVGRADTDFSKTALAADNTPA